MAAIAVELKLECRYCGSPIPLNAVSPKILCYHCLTLISISKESWKEILGEICRRVFDENENRLTFTGNMIPFYVEGNVCMRLYGKEEPMNLNRKPIPMKHALEHLQDNLFSMQGQTVFIRPIPKEYSSFLKSATHFVGEDETQIHRNQNSEIKNPTSSDLVVFTCPSCGGALKIDGTKRILECTYCKVNVYIPDALWFRFHPSKLTRRWYIWFGESYPK